MNRRIKNPLIKFITALIGDENYLRILFKRGVGYKLNLKNPRTYNEKLQWLKLYYRRPELTRMVDKYEAKIWAAERIGEEHIIPTLGVWNSFEEIDFDKLPNRFVLKTTHDSGSVVICKDKAKLDKQAAARILNRSLKHEYWLALKEYPYKDVPKRIIAEQYMEDESGELRDYKIFCFGGKVKALFIATERFKEGEETKFDFFDENFKHLPFVNGHPNATCDIKKPEGFEEMKKLAEKLSAGLPHARVDFYSINGKIYFGEMTFFHWSGLVPFKPVEWDYKFGEWIELPEKYNN